MADPENVEMNTDEMNTDEQQFDDEVQDEQSSDSESQQDSKPFDGLDLREIKCFGFSSPKSDCWVNIANQSVTVGWKNVDMPKLEESLADNVDQSYVCIIQFLAEDVSTGIKWKADFVNDKQLWRLSIDGSPEAEVLLEDKAGFFQSELFIKTMKKATEYIMQAKKTYDELVKIHLDNGEMLKVNEVKLAALLWFINSKGFIDNIRVGKFIM